MSSSETGRLRSSVSATAHGLLRRVLTDSLYQDSLLLLINSASTAAIGVVFWALAARTYSTTDIGVFSSVTSGVGLLAAVAALGLPNTMIRHVKSSDNAEGLLIAAIVAVATIGTILCVVTAEVAGPHLPAALHLREQSWVTVIVTVLVVLVAINGTIDACLIATRLSRAIVIKNVIASVAKVLAMFPLARLGSFGLIVAFGIGLVVSTLLGGLSFNRYLKANGQVAGGSFRLLRRKMSTASANYLATVMGMLPATVVPLEVLTIRGAEQTAWFAVAFLIAGFLNFIPSAVSQVLFAEVSGRKGILAEQLRKAIKAEYTLLLPAVAVIVAGAPILLRTFGAGYIASTGCLRILALSALLTGGTYLVDSLLISRDRMKAYICINGINAALVLSGVAVMLPHGLTAAAAGWAWAQAVSLLIGLILLVLGKGGRHHVRRTTEKAASWSGPDGE